MIAYYSLESTISSMTSDTVLTLTQHHKSIIKVLQSSGVSAHGKRHHMPMCKGHPRLSKEILSKQAPVYE